MSAGKRDRIPNDSFFCRITLPAKCLSMGPMSNLLERRGEPGLNHPNSAKFFLNWMPWKSRGIALIGFTAQLAKNYLENKATYDCQG